MDDVLEIYAPSDPDVYPQAPRGPGVLGLLLCAVLTLALHVLVDAQMKLVSWVFGG